MKTYIEVTGQFAGNIKLSTAIQTFDSEMQKLPFNGYKITFKTKKEAKKALWDAYKWMKANDYNPLKYKKSGSLSYDASRATII